MKLAVVVSIGVLLEVDMYTHQGHAAPTKPATKKNKTVGGVSQFVLWCAAKS